MGYVENNLLPNEKILFVGEVHWSVCIWGIILFLTGLAIIEFTHWIFFFVGIPFTIIGFFVLIWTFIIIKTTELVITSKRVIAKFGLISRTTMELNHSQVESLMVHQGIIGRIFNTGTIIIQGMGGSQTPIPSIFAPLEFRKEYLKIIENNE